MLKKILWGIGIAVILFSAYIVYILATTRNHSPAATATITSNGTTISIDYCRPFKKDRVIFGELLPYGQYWRTGANEPTLIKLDKAVSIGGKTVEAGNYRLYTIPDEKEWTVALNTELEKWGYYEPDYSLDVLRMKVPVENLSSVQEQFLIDIQKSAEGAEVHFAWDRTKVRLPIKI